MATSRYIFVYGTLMSCAKGQLGAEQRARLAMESRPLGRGVVAGYLFDLGDYPGLVVDGPGLAMPGWAKGQVAGEVRELFDAAHVFRWLDPYEDVALVQRPGALYRREQRAAELDGGGSISTWVYIYQGPLAGARYIPGGSWPG